MFAVIAGSTPAASTSIRERMGLNTPMRYYEISAQILNEMMWLDRYAAADAVKHYPRDWVHFSNINKLGINPQKQHKDPPGVYFYPCKWLAGDDASLSQFATESPYYYVVRIKKTKAVINLGTMTMDQVKVAAKASGWGDDLQRILLEPTLLNNAHQPMEKRLLRKPGGFYYACLDYLANVEKRPWMSLLRGVGAIIDPGHGIVASGEPAQAVVIDRTLMTVLAQGENRDMLPVRVAKAMQMAAEEVGGTFSYRHKSPTIAATVQGKAVSVTWDVRTGQIVLGYTKQGHLMADAERNDLGGQTGDLESYVNTFRHRLRTAAERGDGTERGDHAWQMGTLTQAIRLMRPTRQVRTQIDENGRPSARIIEDVMSGMYVGIEMNVDANDILTVRPWFDRRRDGDDEGGEVEEIQTFKPGTTPQQIYDAVMPPFLEKCLASFKGKIDVDKLAKFMHFRFPGSELAERGKKKK